MSPPSDQSPAAKPIVHENHPLTLIGGADLNGIVLNICLSQAPITVAVDGGADQCLASGLSPLAVIGDLDSISDAARSKYHHILHRFTDQDTTDFEKAVTQVDAPLILAAGFLGGRIDHQMAILNTMWRTLATHVVLVGPDDVICLVDRPVSLTLPVDTRIALLPLADVRVKTTGLVWNLDGDLLSPAGTISSSNAVQSPTVRIIPEGPVFLTLPLSALDAVIAAVRAR